MKIVISIPKKTFDEIRERNITHCGEPFAQKLVSYIRNGTPLNHIRSEIADLGDADYDYEGYYKAVTDALKIIDKYKTEKRGSGMTFEEKAGIVISQLRADRDRLLDALDKIRDKIAGYKSSVDNAISEDELKIEGMKEAYADCLKIIDKYTAEEECSYEDLINSLE